MDKFLMRLRATLPHMPVFSAPKLARNSTRRTHKKSYASRLASRSPSSGENDDESPESYTSRVVMPSFRCR